MWNSIPYTRNNSLSPESFVNPHTAIDDICLPNEVETYHDEGKFIVQIVTELIRKELVKQEGLEGGDVEDSETILPYQRVRLLPNWSPFPAESE